MKRIIAIITALSGLILLVGCGASIVSSTPSSTTEPKIYTRNDLNITTGLNTKFIIELESPGKSDGYAWAATEFDSAILKVTDMSEGKITRFTFITTAKGETKLTMRYAMADEGFNIMETLPYVIKVE